MKDSKPKKPPAKARQATTARKPRVQGDAPDPGTALAEQAGGLQALAAAMPFNTGKPREIGRAHALNPPEGQHVAPRSASLTASTLSEANV